jgi:hypothetical protein
MALLIASIAALMLAVLTADSFHWDLDEAGMPFRSPGLCRPPRGGARTFG